MELGPIEWQPPQGDWLSFETVTGQSVHLRARRVWAVSERTNGECVLTGEGIDLTVKGEHGAVLKAIQTAQAL